MDINLYTYTFRRHIKRYRSTTSRRCLLPVSAARFLFGLTFMSYTIKESLLIVINEFSVLL